MSTQGNITEKLQKKFNKQLLDMEQKKKLSLVLASSYKRLGKEKKYWKVQDCGTFLEFKIFNQANEICLSGANFCKDRLCPQCAKRRSLKTFHQLSKVIDCINKDSNNNIRYLFVTLTLKNCKPENLENTLQLLSNGFSNFRHSRFFRGKSKVFLGCFRSTELTYNEEFNEWHPHIHLLIAVNKYYFSKTNSFYVGPYDISEIWRNCLDLDYYPIVDIRAVKSLKDCKKEVSKYITKSSCYLFPDKPNLTDYLVNNLSDALYNKRFISFVGIFNKAYKKLKLDDNDDLINIDELNNCKELDYIIRRYSWNIGLSCYKKFYL